MKLWTVGGVVDLAGRCVDASLRVEKSLDHGKVEVGDALAWGQYIDKDHHSESQWGFFGTSAAVQVFASNSATAHNDTRIDSALKLLPESVEDYDDRIKPKVLRGQLTDVVRLATIAEALRPRDHLVAKPQWPALVETILDRSRGQSFWRAEEAAEGKQATTGDPLATAFILHALRRYEHPLRTGFRDYREWLAGQLLGRGDVKARPNMVALIGLALLPVEKDPSPPAKVSEALECCKSKLLEWRRHERGLVTSRPIFAGYQLGQQTEYVLLNPELLAALFFLRYGNPHKARAFVLNVTAEVAENIETHEGFEGQPGASPTVDQMWAVKLLRTVSSMNDDPGQQLLLRPRISSALQFRWRTVLVAVVVMGIVVGATSDWALGAILTFFFSAFVNVGSALAQDQR